jgi:hypothetical protein
LAACAGISNEKISAMIRTGIKHDAALKRAAVHFRYHEVTNRRIEESREESVCVDVDFNQVDAPGSLDASELDEDENLMERKNTELSLSRKLRHLVDSDATYRKLAGFFNKYQGRGLRVLYKMPAKVFSSDFGVQMTFPVPSRAIQVNGYSFSHEYCLRVASKDLSRTREILTVLEQYKNDIAEVESVRINECQIFVIGVNSVATAVSLRSSFGVQVHRQQLQCSVWYATSEVIENCYYPELSLKSDSEKRMDVSAFLDGFGGMGYTKQTCALKVSELEGELVVTGNGYANEKFSNASNVICEFVGDESGAMDVLEAVVQSSPTAWTALIFKFLTVDHKAQQYVMLVPGPRSKHKFPYLAALSELEYANVKDVGYYTHENLKFSVSDISEMWKTFLRGKYNRKLAALVKKDSKSRTELNAKLRKIADFRFFSMFRESVVVPAMFHAYTLHVSHYVLQAFAYGTNTTVRNLLDLLDCVHVERRIHGMPYKTGDARRFISYAEALYMKNDREKIANLGSDWQSCIHLLALCNELQQILYCKYSPSLISMFRLRVVTRLLAEAVARSDLEKYLVHNAAAKKADKAVKTAILKAHGAGTSREAIGVTGQQPEGDGSGSSIIASDGESIDEKHANKLPLVTKSIEVDSPMMRHVYWPNLYIALPCLAEKFPAVRINRLNEEIHEQSWLTNTRFLAASRGRQDFQTMQYTSFTRRSSVATRPSSLASKKDYRYVDYRDILVKRELVSKQWLAALRSHYGNLVVDEDIYYRFKTRGDNASKAGRTCVADFSSAGRLELSGNSADDCNPWRTPEELVVNF